MSIEVGAKVSGKVTGITNFGAFVDLGNNQSGLVHISEVSNSFVKDIHDVLKVGDEVTVKVLSMDNGKIALSIKKAMDNPHNHNNHGRKDFENHHQNNKPRNNKVISFNKHNNHKNETSFDQMLSGFLKDSESRLSTLKKNTDGKRGGRGGRRS